MVPNVRPWSLTRLARHLTLRASLPQGDREKKSWITTARIVSVKENAEGLAAV